MKVRRYFIIVAVFFCFQVNSQTNLGSNPGFENHTICPTFGGQFNTCSNWNNVNLIYRAFTVGTSDDGRTSGGQGVTDGTYFYIVNIESGSKLKGTVTLFR